MFAEQDLLAVVEQSADQTHSLRGQVVTTRGMRGRGRGQRFGIGAGRGRGGRGRGATTSAGARGKAGGQIRAKRAKQITYVCCHFAYFICGIIISISVVIAVY